MAARTTSDWRWNRSTHTRREQQSTAGSRSHSVGVRPAALPSHICSASLRLLFRLVWRQVYAIDRQGEDERFKAHSNADNRQLLWHGSRTTNFVGILSQGLRIAPPEAPATGRTVNSCGQHGLLAPSFTSYTPALTHDSSRRYFSLCRLHVRKGLSFSFHSLYTLAPRFGRVERSCPDSNHQPAARPHSLLPCHPLLLCHSVSQGIYLADMVSKSAGYCFVQRNNPTGCLLLCEAALGSMNELFDADFNASSLPSGKHSTKGMGSITPDSRHFVKLDDGCVIPSGPPVEADTTRKPSLLYNEYVVYHESQVRLRYLVKMMFSF